MTKKDSLNVEPSTHAMVSWQVIKLSKQESRGKRVFQLVLVGRQHYSDVKISITFTEMLRTSLGSAVSSSQINDLAFYISFSYFSGEQFTKKNFSFTFQPQ